MRSFRSFKALPKNAFVKPTAVTIGKFDGLHLGHRAIIERLAASAAQHDLESAVFTFTENPLATLNPGSCPPELASAEQRLELLAAAGISAALMVDFTRELASFTPEQFVSDVLVAGLNVKYVLVGADFRFGLKGEGDVRTLTTLGHKMGFAVEISEDIAVENTRVSSTNIRNLLLAGDVSKANKLLGHAHWVRGMVVHGAARGRSLGFPTANLEPHYEGLAPADGVYAGIATVRGIDYAAAVSIGGNPTFTPEAPSQIEVHLLDFAENIYGENLSLKFVQRLRGMTAYTGVEALLKQIEHDVAQTRELIKI